MRDYKNVKVPRKYRTRSTRTVKRVDVSRTASKPAKAAPGGGKTVLLNIFGFAAAGFFCWSCWHAYAWLTRSEIFQIARVDVRGVRLLADADLKKIVGEFTGQNIFRADLQAAVRRARANQWIKDARIQRSLPNRITMDVVERRPHALLDTGTGRYLIDSEAVAIERVTGDARAADLLPVISIRNCRAVPGEPVTAETMTEALMLLSEIGARGGWDISDITVKAGSRESLSLLYAGNEFKIGSGNYGEKLRRLSEVMRDVYLRGLNIAYVDLRAERQAAVMVSEAKTPKHRRRKTDRHR
jgi:cell division septal protein FtsQ